MDAVERVVYIDDSVVVLEDDALSDRLDVVHDVHILVDPGNGGQDLPGGRDLQPGRSRLEPLHLRFNHLAGVRGFTFGELHLLLSFAEKLIIQVGVFFFFFFIKTPPFRHGLFFKEK